MRIGIVSAFGKETKPLRSKLEEIRRESIKTYVFFLLRYGDEDVMVAKTGSGKVQGAEGARLLIERFHPGIIVNCGVAGAISPERKIGDVVISRRVIEYDTIDDNNLKDKVYYADANLFHYALQVSNETMQKRKTVAGDVLSGDRVVKEVHEREALWKRFQGECVEQEGAGVARICQLHNIPWIVIKGISDRADEHALTDFKKNVDSASKNVALVTIEIMKRVLRGHPGTNI
ncbi:MAG: 5'-methylthioadenosine/S-adenosylhomocysteine nucleosidase [Gemmatimonadota bacterium]|nr:MAG: 5'-methylthioadenosine/S-adenosylhomocysteine nucleosidase [Gemmatimonadota bacterium]